MTRHPVTATIGWLVALLLPLVAASAQEPPTLAHGWRATVIADHLPRVDNIATAADGALFVTLEQSPGTVLWVRGDQRRTVLSGLQRPDGLKRHGTTLWVTEETRNGRLLAIDLTHGQVTEHGRFNNPEGLIISPDGTILIAEDSHNGRIIAVTPKSTQVLVSGLSRPEGLALGPDGTLFIAETGSGRVLAWNGKGLRVVVDQLREPDQLAFDADGALWISEDKNPGRLLRFDGGDLTVIAAGLASPQGIAFRGDAVLVAEQDRGRILELTRP